MLNRVFLILCLFFVFSSCEKEVVDFINITFTPENVVDEFRNSGEIIPFSIKLSSNSELSELVIVQIVNNSIIDTMYHEQISGLEKTELYNYTCPDISSLDTSEFKLIFYCSNANGDINERAKVFSVVSKNVYLSETTGHTMFSNNSSEFNSYNLVTGTAAYNSDTTTHISDNTDSISDILSREWVSMSGLLFSKNNSFDYANATLEGIEDTYSTSVKKEFVDQISENDIIITKIEDNYVIIKIIIVRDNYGSEEDRYIFNIKY
jgi:hypothetical protein